MNNQPPIDEVNAAMRPTEPIGSKSLRDAGALAPSDGKRSELGEVSLPRVSRPSKGMLIKTSPVRLGRGNVDQRSEQRENAVSGVSPQRVRADRRLRRLVDECPRSNFRKKAPSFYGEIPTGHQIISDRERRSTASPAFPKQGTVDQKSDILVHPEDYWKKEWVLSRKSIHAGGLIIDHHIEPPDEIEVKQTKHHLIGYLLNDFGPRQITRIDSKEYDGENGRGDFWLKPSSSEGFWHWESTDNCLKFAIEPTFLSQIAVQNDCLYSDKIEILPVLKNRDPIFNALAMQFKKEMDNAEFGNLMYVESLANQFAIHLLREYCTFPMVFKEYAGGLPSYKLKQAIEYINARLNEPIKITDIAKLVDISQYYFCRLFNESTGVSPYQYVIRQRVTRVKNFLKHSKLPLSDIAFECGFSSQSQMTYHFRKCVGVTPKVYRNKL